MTNQKQKVLSSKTIFRAKLFEVKELTMNFTSSNEKIFHQVDGNPTVAIFPLTDRNEIYLIDQYRYMFGSRVLGAIAGHVDQGENALAAAKRELKEETGIEAQQWELFAKVENSRSVIRAQIYMYLAKNLEIGISEPELGEDITLVKLPLQEAVDKVLNGQIYHSPSMAGILILAELRRRKQL